MGLTADGTGTVDGTGDDTVDGTVQLKGQLMGHHDNCIIQPLSAQACKMQGLTCHSASG